MKYFIVSVFILITNHVFAQGNRSFWFTMGDGKQANALYMSEVPGFKADLERLCGITLTNNAGQWQATNTQRPFTAADNGKILIVKNARSWPQYRKAPFTLNAVISTVTNGIANITSFDKLNQAPTAGTIIAVTTGCGFIATDMFDIFQKAIDTCAARGKTVLKLDYTGTAYMVPQRSNRLRPRSIQPSLVINNSLSIEGIDSSLTKIKLGMEDISRRNDLLNPYYCAFWIKNSTLRLKKLSLISADRASTNNDHQNVEAIHGDADYKLGLNIIVDKCNIISHDPYGYEGWGSVAYMNSAIPINATDSALMSFTNCTISGQAGISFFSRNVSDNRDNGINGYSPVDTLNRLMRLTNCKVFSGARYSRKSQGWVEAKPTTDTIIVHNSPEFSFYDLTDYERPLENYRQPIIAIARNGYTNAQLDTTQMYWAWVRVVVNDSTAIIDTTYRDLEYDREGAPSGSASFSTSSNIVTGSGSNYTSAFGLVAGDRIYTDRFTVVDGVIPQYIGTILTVNSATSLTLTANALWDSSGLGIFTNPVSAAFPHAGYDASYRFRPVPWATTTTSVLYTARRVHRYAAFHNTYISGSVGVDFRNNYYEALRNGRNAQNNACPNPYTNPPQGITICGSCFNYSEVPVNNYSCYNNPYSYSVQGELKVMVDGLGYGLSYGASCELLPAAPQKR